MKRLIWTAVICLFASVAVRSQAPGANPVSAKLRQILDNYSKDLVAAAEEMPAEKYSYHPMPEQMTFGKSVDHVAEVNNFACSKISGVPAPGGAKINETDKDKLVEELKASMDYCKQAFSKLTDATLGEQVPWFGGRQVTRVSAALEVTNDLIDHYAALAVYLRLNNLLPPTAQPKK
jgi:uncharacterized damage-inducible protein DinB